MKRAWASPNSYAGRTGRPANIGVIGVVFREREPVNRSRDASENAGSAEESRTWHTFHRHDGRRQR